MESESLLLFPPVWFLAASVLVAAAASRLTRRSRKRRGDGKPDSTAKWVLVCVYVSAAVAAATVGLLAPTVRDYLNGPMLVACCVTAAIALPALRFRKAVGVPVVVLLAAVVVLGGLFLQSLVAFGGETEIAVITVAPQRDGRLTLEIAPASGAAETAELAGDYFAPIVKVVVFDDALVFLGSRTWYRFVGVTSFRLEREGESLRFRQADDHYLQRPTGITEALYAVFERCEDRIPGVKTVQVEMDLKRVDPAEAGPAPGAYSVRVQNDGGVQIVRR
jgi:hypothetical protein